MLIKSLLAALLLGSSLLVSQDADQDAPRAGEYIVDGGHSSVLFRVTHLGVGAFWGRFNQVEGKLHYDAEDAGKCSVSITIPTASIDTNSQGRDDHLTSPDFFNAKEFPELTFESSRVMFGDDGVLTVAGTLTMLGEEKVMRFDAVPVGHGDRGGRFGYRAGWEGEFTIQRSDFGMEFMTGMLGDDIRVIVALETVLP